MWVCGWIWKLSGDHSRLLSLVCWKKYYMFGKWSMWLVCCLVSLLRVYWRGCSQVMYVCSSWGRYGLNWSIKKGKRKRKGKKKIDKRKEIEKTPVTQLLTNNSSLYYMNSQHWIPNVGSIFIVSGAPPMTRELPESWQGQLAGGWEREGYFEGRKK